MAPAWHPLGALAVFECVVLVAVGLAIYLAGPRRPANRWLALTLGFQAFADATFPMATLFPEDPATQQALNNLNWVASLLAVFVYLAFLGAALETPLVRPWATPRRRQVTAGLGFAAAAALVPTEGLLPTWVTVLTLGGAVLCFVYGLVAAIDAWRRAPRGSVKRTRNAAYARAFGFRDAAFIALIIPLPFVAPATQLLLTGGILVVQLLYVALLAHAILREHLFDIDLRLKWTVRRGVVVGIFLAAFFVVVAIAEQWLQQYGVVFGGAAVGILLFALRPIERAADRLADAAMPNVEPTPAYVAHKKLEVYKAAVESAHETGGIDAREKAALDRLREKLGIAEPDARAVEREVAGG